MTTEALDRVDPAQFATARDRVVALDDAARAADGHESLGEAVWRDLAQPAPGSAGFFADARAYVHVARTQPVDPAAWTAGLVRAPGARDRAVTTRLLDAAAAHVAERGGRRLTCWVFGATAADDEAFAAAGYDPERTLFEMRVALPLAETARWPAGISVRAFEPGRDDAAWLSVNNRAFAGHPEQGGWRPADLTARLQEAWFDPELFLLAFDAEGLAGFDWLKPHPAVAPDPALGEIYVIGVDPRAQGTGLGRALAVEGLHVVHRRGAVEGMLFCAADNAGALALYRALGFTVHRTDRAYVHEMEAP